MQTSGRRPTPAPIVARLFPDRRLFLRSEHETRFLRLTPGTQLVAVLGSALILGWTIVASSILLMDSIGAGNLRDQTMREQQLYEDRLNALAEERDVAVTQAVAAHERFNAALAAVSDMQTALLASETRRSELSRGIDVVQASLRRTVGERDAARDALTLRDAETDGLPLEDRLVEADATLDVMTAALGSTAAQRDALVHEMADAEQVAEQMHLKARTVAARNDAIFAQLEEALTISVAPLDKMFSKAGLSTDALIGTVRQGHTGQGGPLTPIAMSTRGQEPDADSLRANAILETLDRMNLYRIAAEKAPFAIPVDGSFRFTSGFGPRWGRMHEGTDFAGAHGTPIVATADGTVVHAGRQSGYGNLVKIRHEFGIETRYAHLSKLRVEVGQRVSRGDVIGDMGSTGRSTGTHLHYEVRVNGRAVNPMTYIKAANDVF